MSTIAFVGSDNIGSIHSEHNKQLYELMREVIYNQLKDNFYVTVMTNLEPGVGELAYLAATSLKNEFNHHVIIEVVVPTRDESAYTTETNLKRDKYFELADKVISVGRTRYSSELVIRSIEYINEHSDIMYTVWNGKKDNTHSFIRKVMTSTGDVNLIDYDNNVIHGKLEYSDFIIKELLM